MMQEFKIRASAAGRIMSGSIGLSEKQASTLASLILRKQKAEQGEAKPLTANMQRDLDDLMHKQMNIELPQGAKTYCKQWLKEHIYNRRKEVQTKYMDKGNANEDESLDFVAEQLGLGMLIKNEESFEDEYMKGTPDAIPAEYVIDVKNSWDCFSFPLLENASFNMDYYWQAQVYMHLTGKTDYRLIYTLTDTPVHLIQREAEAWCRRNEYGELDQDKYDEFYERMTYKDLEPALKMKIYEFKYNPDDIKHLQKRVEMCREYINKLITKNNLHEYTNFTINRS